MVPTDLSARLVSDDGSSNTGRHSWLFTLSFVWFLVLSVKFMGPSSDHLPTYQCSAPPLWEQPKPRVPSSMKLPQSNLPPHLGHHMCFGLWGPSYRVWSTSFLWRFPSGWWKGKKKSFSGTGIGCPSLNSYLKTYILLKEYAWILNYTL